MPGYELSAYFEIGDDEYRADGRVWYQQGVHTLSNGDPGWPDEWDIENMKVFHYNVDANKWYQLPDDKLTDAISDMAACALFDAYGDRQADRDEGYDNAP